MASNTSKSDSKGLYSDSNDNSSGRDVVWAKINSITPKTVPSVRIRGSTFSIGRHPSNDLQIVDARLSGMHCRITRFLDGEGRMKVHLTDLSTNGTYLNGEIVSKSQSTFLFAWASAFLNPLLILSGR